MKSILSSGILAPMIFLAADLAGETGGASPAATNETAPAPEPFTLPPTPPVSETVEIELKKIVIDAGTQPRVAIDEEVVKEYAEIIKQCIKDEQPIPFPPVTVFRDPTGRCVLADGFHRFLAHKMAHAKEIECEIREGDEEAALFYSLGANQQHGLRRSNKDKQRAVKMAVNNEKLKTLPNTEIARLCGVSEFMVRELRPAAKQSATRTVTIRGKKTTMDTAAIGKGKGGGKKGAAKEAKKGGGKKGETATAAGPTKEQNEAEMDRLLGKIASNCGAEGGKFRAGVRDGALTHITLRDLRDFEGIDPKKQKGVLALVMGGPRMKPGKAFEFLHSELSEKIQTELHNRALGSDKGQFTFEGEGFTVTVKLAKAAAPVAK